MSRKGARHVRSSFWRSTRFWPGLSIFLIVMSFNLLGDGLRDALDPREQ